MKREIKKAKREEDKIVATGKETEGSWYVPSVSLLSAFSSTPILFKYYT
ncbi:1977_t:CDS:1 [Dentiscutata erythropus]|uniref:1977_t:CDS:1 n=1 Tax=Dentiscutata erythropus TaxID=1348616 RepID=A0A9N9DA31_9GLOM|nr:1977_t:CDS:1 [Dentiscutata erythropus]